MKIRLYTTQKRQRRSVVSQAVLRKGQELPGRVYLIFCSLNSFGFFIRVPLSSGLRRIVVMSELLLQMNNCLFVSGFKSLHMICFS